MPGPDSRCQKQEKSINTISYGIVNAAGIDKVLVVKPVSTFFKAILMSIFLFLALNFMSNHWAKASFWYIIDIAASIDTMLGFKTEQLIFSKL